MGKITTNREFVIRNSHFLDFCNSIPLGTVDKSISSSVLKHCNHLENITIDNISEEANTSNSSIIRFFSKAGYSNFTQFKYEYTIYLNTIESLKDDIQKKVFGDCDFEHFIEKYYELVNDNMSSTINNIEMSTVKKMCQLILESKKVYIYGEKHALTEFGIVQLYMLMHGIDVNLISISEDYSISHMKKDDVVIVLSVSSEWFCDDIIQILLNAKNNSCQSFLFTQDDISNASPDFCIHYGIPNENRLGYYSLSLVSEIISYTFTKLSK